MHFWLRTKADEVIDPSTATSVRTAYKSRLESELVKSASNPDEIPQANMLQDQWSSMVWPGSPEADKDPDTGVQKEVLENVGRASVRVGENFVSYLFIRLVVVHSGLMSCSHACLDGLLVQEIHPRLKRHVKHRLQAIESGKGLDWATAEVRAWIVVSRLNQD